MTHARSPRDGLANGLSVALLVVGVLLAALVRPETPHANPLPVPRPFPHSLDTLSPPSPEPAAAPAPRPAH